MRRTITILIAAVAIFLSTGFAIAQSLIVTGPVTISRDTTFTSVTVESGGILTADGLITVNGDLTIKSGGVVTHSDRLLSGLVLNVTGKLDVQTGGIIDLRGKGLRGGRNGSAFGTHGETYDASNVIISAGNGANVAAGASYGGQGGNSIQGVSANAPYGFLENPQHLGSGGGGGGDGVYAARGGHGGGRLRITAGNCIVNGTIRANGLNGEYNSANISGGGSGGAIRLDVGTLSGTGSIEAFGGNALEHNGRYCGSGSGGRIAIYYNTMSFPTENLQIYGGYAGVNAAAGTIYLKDKARANGDLIIQNGNIVSALYTPLTTNLTTFRNMKILNKGRLHVNKDHLTSFTINQPVSLTTNADFRLGAGVTLAVPNNTGFDFDVQSEASATLDSSAVLNANALRINGGILNAHIDMAFLKSSDLELSGKGTINVLSNTTFSLARVSEL